MATIIGDETQQTSQRDTWSSRMAFILAATGSAVGLGNIWKFPYITGENGGGAFVLVYLISIAIIGIPIMMAEVMIGRSGRKNPISAMRLVAKRAGKSGSWQLVGWMGVASAFIILSFYSVIAGWALSYIGYAASGTFTGASADSIGAIFSSLLADPKTLLMWHSLFMLLTVVVVARGVRAGLERAVTLLMPALFVLLLAMVGYAMAEGDFARGFTFLFQPDFSKLTTNAVLIAMGHAFFTLSLGMGAMMAYGSFLPENVSIAKTAITVSILDTAVALLAGLAIFPIVFANGLEPSAGPGLVFQSLPLAFGQMPGGALFGTLFFVLLVFAAWTSSISLLEPLVEWLEENRGMNRKIAAIGGGVSIWLLGLLSVFSFNIWSDVKPLSMFKLFESKTLFDLLDYLTTNIMLPLGGLLAALFVGWALSSKSAREALEMEDNLQFKTWHTLVRYITPIAVLTVFLYNLA